MLAQILDLRLCAFLSFLDFDLRLCWQLSRFLTSEQRWSRGHKARGQGHKKKSEAKDSLSEDRHSRGQGQECSRPRTQAQVLSKKKGLHKNFSGDLKKKKREGLHKNFLGDHKKTFSKKFIKRSTKF